MSRTRSRVELTPGEAFTLVVNAAGPVTIEGAGAVKIMAPGDVMTIEVVSEGRHHDE